LMVDGLLLLNNCSVSQSESSTENGDSAIFLGDTR
jgi:hypothetical protein